MGEEKDYDQIVINDTGVVCLCWKAELVLFFLLISILDDMLYKKDE